MPVRYRADIDGLRAIAVLGVVFYHVGIAGVSGGYVGVDVFFVISGYLITGILAREIETGQFSLSEFYQRRVRRIVPALAVVVSASTFAAALILFPSDFKEYGRSLLNIAGLVSNFYFARKTGYFDGAADEKPLLHTWSLAVEEQFYLLFPLLLWGLFRWRHKSAIGALAILAALSLLISVSETAHQPERAFFSSGARAWELLLGALCALNTSTTQWPKILRECVAGGGLALIVIAYMVFSDETPFPGYIALLPCLGAAGVILGSQSGETLVAKVLALRAVVGIGLISYSLYLWHWPLLVFAKYRLALSPSSSFAQAAALILASTSLAYLSWRYVEQPCRRPTISTSRKVAFGAAGSFLAATAAAGLLIAKSGGFPGRWPTEIAATALRSGGSLPCRPAPEATGWPAGTCLLGSKAAQFDTLIWGDSHAGMLADGIAKELARTQHGAIRVSMGGCPPLLGVSLHGRAKQEACKASATQVLAKLADGNVRRVILAARWALYAEGDRMPQEGGQPSRLAPTQSENGQIFGRLLNETVTRIKPLVQQIVLIGPVPEVDFPVGRAIAGKIAWGRPLPPATRRASFDLRQRHVFPVLAALALKLGVRIIFPDRWLCDASVCPYATGDQPLYVDTNHLNSRGERRLKQMFGAIFADTAQSVTVLSGDEGHELTSCRLPACK